jgi:phosphoglycerol transferase MdoB-like AlkP superfamily enzyme
MLGLTFIKKQNGLLATVLAAALIVAIAFCLVYIGCLMTAWAYNLVLADLFGWPRFTVLHAFAFFILLGILKGSIGINTKKGG